MPAACAVAPRALLPLAGLLLDTCSLLPRTSPLHFSAEETSRTYAAVMVFLIVQARKTGYAGLSLPDAAPTWRCCCRHS